MSNPNVKVFSGNFKRFMGVGTAAVAAAGVFAGYSLNRTNSSEPIRQSTPAALTATRNLPTPAQEATIHETLTIAAEPGAETLDDLATDYENDNHINPNVVSPYAAANDLQPTFKSDNPSGFDPNVVVPGNSFVPDHKLIAEATAATDQFNAARQPAQPEHGSSAQ